MSFGIKNTIILFLNLKQRNNNNEEIFEDKMTFSSSLLTILFTIS